MKHSLTLLLAMAVLLAWFTPAARGATDAEIDQAIQDGLAWLATQQNSDGSFGSGYNLANTATAVLAFENEGHFPGGGTAYSANVEKGLDYLLECSYKIGINPQTRGYSGRNDDPDTNGNGQGVYFSQSSYMYETGLVMQALVASNTPDRVVVDVDYTTIAAGNFHNLALKADGSIKSWGSNDNGQVSNTPAGYDFVDIAAGSRHSLALKADGSIVGWGSNGNGQATPPSGTNYVAIAAGSSHSLALKSDGSLVGWGRNHYDQATPPADNDYVAIAARFYQSLALKADGSIVGWGYNYYGQATPPAGSDYVAIAAGGFHSLALKDDGSIVGWGRNQYGQINVPAGNDYTAIAAGSNHSLALKADGSIKSWGWDGYGNGQVSNTPAGYDFVAIAAASRHSLALKADGSIVGWGYNNYGQGSGPGGACIGMTYEEVMTDLVDFLAWAQTDAGTGRGGWRYQAYNNRGAYSDNSVAQWPVLGLVAAEQWGIYAPQFVKDEMEHWVTYIQNDNGGSGYSTPTSYVNIAKTGGLLVEFYYLGDNKNTQRAQSARSFIDSRWNVAPYGSYYGNKGHPYAMFSVFKGLELMQVLTVPNAPANPDTPAGDWWGDYCEYLVNTQRSGLGYWDGYSGWGRYLATPWYIIILQASVFPISVDIVVPGVACDLTGYQVDVHYSVARFEASGTLSVYRDEDEEPYDTVTLTDFRGEATVTYYVAPEEIGSHTWKAVLDVTGGGISTQAEDTDGTEVYATPQVTDIPDQFSPFETFDLDDYQTCECDDVEWAALGVPEGWTVTIDAENVVTVTAPEGATYPADITFQATFHWPGIDCIDSDTATFSPNRPPVADPGRDYFADPKEKYYAPEGGEVTLEGSASDPDGDAITYVAWDLDDDGVYGETGADALNGDETGYTPTFSAALLDGKVDVYIFLKVCDEHGACDIGMAEVEVQNVAPTIDAITAPLDPVNINDQPVSVEVTFSDPGIPDTHEVTWDWGDETSDIQPGATSPASAEHTYEEAGVYTVTVTVTDDDGGTVSETYEFIVIYDPSGGFVTGGGWIDSPEGAYKPEPSLTGKANFGFVSKYKKGANVPTGQTEFQFKTAGLNFHSSSYEWLVVTGSDFARYKGAGTINGEGDYNFMLWAGDKPDTFRIKIWEEDEEGVETVIYDNGFDQPIGGGSIVVHSK